jgi:uncharacterized protein HemY
MCSADFEVREIDCVVLTGRSRQQTVYEVMGRKDVVAPQQTQLRAHYAAGLTAYRERRWQEAGAAFAAALEAAPDDGPSIALLARVTDLKQNPPPESWDGSWRMKDK